mmetsp:Transcript_21705/g.59676  ORF Transcript_21705/g.59676 Transcript_21705/m.59676 type:complete len:205 (-) Transcript_21705:271-885(-)
MDDSIGRSTGISASTPFRLAESPAAEPSMPMQTAASRSRRTSRAGHASTSLSHVNSWPPSRISLWGCPVRTFPSWRRSARVCSRISPPAASRPSASCRGTACSPAAGSAASPSANMRRTNSNMMEDCFVRGAKKMPPKKGLKKEPINPSESPQFSANNVCVGMSTREKMVSIFISLRRMMARTRRALSISEATGKSRVSRVAEG